MHEIQRKFGLSDFVYDLPEHLVAQHPLDRRDEARLLVREIDGVIKDAIIKDLDAILPCGTVLVVNNSMVFPSRLLGIIEGNQKKVEVFLLHAIPGALQNMWTAIGKPGRFLREGTKIVFSEDCYAVVTEHHAKIMGFNLEFSIDSAKFSVWLDHNGYIPLPPYIHRTKPKPADQSEDRESYQTIYACNRGSVAAPTAGLHFTNDLLQRFVQKDISIVPVTLHVGAGTFLPVKHEDLSCHQMHQESFYVPLETDKAIQNARKEGRKVIAVGTTSLRCLESYFRLCNVRGESLANSWLATDLFIYPQMNQVSYKPAFLDGLITNFHQPGSTLFMLVSALLSLQEARRVYAHAISLDYRFLSYGDASLFWL